MYNELVVHLEREKDTGVDWARFSGKSIQRGVLYSPLNIRRLYEMAVMYV